VSCRAAKLDVSPPSSCITGTASGCIGCATTARVPALDALKSGTCKRAPYATARRSAVGDRQMFPVQTNNMCRVDSSSQQTILRRALTALVCRRSAFSIRVPFEVCPSNQARQNIPVLSVVVGATTAAVDATCQRRQLLGHESVDTEVE
jgi:hypothetical protein